MAVSPILLEFPRCRGPKILTVPSSLTFTLADFKSRWMTPASWAASNASAISFAIGRASSTGIGPLAMRSARVGLRVAGGGWARRSRYNHRGRGSVASMAGQSPRWHRRVVHPCGPVRLGRARIAVQSPDMTEPIVLADGTHPTYLPTGHIVFARDYALWVVPFDLVWCV